MSKIFQNFLEGYGTDVDFKLLFYVLPIILNKDSRRRLIKANKASKLETVFKKENYKEYSDIKLSAQSNLSGFKDKFIELKDLTKTTIIILVNEEKIIIGNSVMLLKTDNYSNYKDPDIVSLLRSSFYLGVIFNKSRVEQLDYYLGVKNNWEAI